VVFATEKPVQPAIHTEAEIDHLEAHVGVVVNDNYFSLQ
jgi:hypothetical protein